MIKLLGGGFSNLQNLVGFVDAPSGNFNNLTGEENKTVLYRIAREDLSNSFSSATQGRCFALVMNIANSYITQVVFNPNDGENATYQRSYTGFTWSAWSRNDNYRTTSLSGLASALGVTLEMYEWQHIPSGADVPIDDNQLIVTFKMPNNNRDWGKISFGDSNRVYVKSVNSAGTGDWTLIAGTVV